MSPSVDDLVNQWVSGWIAACKKIKAELTDATQKVDDAEAHKAMETMFKSIDQMEKSAFTEAPTVIARSVSGLEGS